MAKGDIFPFKDKLSTEERPFEKATELFARGEFSKMRDALGNRGEPHEVNILLNFLRTLPEGRSKMPRGHLSDKLWTAQGETPEFYETLFSILREAGFTAEDRPAIEQYFEGIREANEKPRWTGSIEEDAENQRLQGLKQMLGNASSALDSVFPSEPT